MKRKRTLLLLALFSIAVLLIGYNVYLALPSQQRPTIIKCMDGEYGSWSVIDNCGQEVSNAVVQTPKFIKAENGSTYVFQYNETGLPESQDNGVVVFRGMSLIYNSYGDVVHECDGYSYVSSFIQVWVPELGNGSWDVSNMTISGPQPPMCS
jgi:hypothetical protein